MAVNPSALGQNKGLSELWRRLRFVFMAIIYRIGTHIPILELIQINSKYLSTKPRYASRFIQYVLWRGFGEDEYYGIEHNAYITSIIMSLLEGTTPSLKKRFREEGEEGRRLRTSYVRYGTVVLALIQATGLALGLQNQGLALEPGFMFQLIAVTSLVSGTVFLMWLGELVTEKGIGNGISIIIFSSIVAGLPRAIGQAFEGARQGDINLVMLLSIALVAVAAIAFIVWIERGQRRITVNYVKDNKVERWFKDKPRICL